MTFCRFRFSISLPHRLLMWSRSSLQRLRTFHLIVVHLSTCDTLEASPKATSQMLPQHAQLSHFASPSYPLLSLRDHKPLDILEHTRRQCAINANVSCRQGEADGRREISKTLSICRVSSWAIYVSVSSTFAVTSSLINWICNYTCHMPHVVYHMLRTHTHTHSRARAKSKQTTAAVQARSLRSA